MNSSLPMMLQTLEGFPKDWEALSIMVSTFIDPLGLPIDLSMWWEPGDDQLSRLGLDAVWVCWSLGDHTKPLAPLDEILSGVPQWLPCRIAWRGETLVFEILLGSSGSSSVLHEQLGAIYEFLGSAVLLLETTV